MNRYLAKLMFSVHVEGDTGIGEFDEQIRIVESLNMEGAFYKARAVGKKEEGNIPDNENKKIEWRFIDVLELYAIEEVKDGEQLYSSTHKTDDSGSYINYIRQKSMEIQAKNLTFV